MLHPYFYCIVNNACVNEELSTFCLIESLFFIFLMICSLVGGYKVNLFSTDYIYLQQSLILEISGFSSFAKKDRFLGASHASQQKP